MSKRLAGGRENDHEQVTNRVWCFCAHPNHPASIHIAGHSFGLHRTKGVPIVCAIPWCAKYV